MMQPIIQTMYGAEDNPDIHTFYPMHHLCSLRHTSAQDAEQSGLQQSHQMPLQRYLLSIWVGRIETKSTPHVGSTISKHPAGQHHHCTRFRFQDIILYFCICTSRALHINTSQCTRFLLQDIRLFVPDCEFIFVFVSTSVYLSEHQPVQHQPDCVFQKSVRVVRVAYLYLYLSEHQPGQHQPVHQIISSTHPFVCSGLCICICLNIRLVNTIRCTRFRLSDIRLCGTGCVFVFVFVWTSVYLSEHQPGQHHPVHQIPSSRHPSVWSGLSAGTRSSLSSSSLGGKQDDNSW